MRKLSKIIFTSIFILLMFNIQCLFSQNDEMVGGNRKPKIWKRWRHKERFNSEPFNPYLKKKKKNLPSAEMSRQDKKILKKQKRMAKKQMRKNKREYHSK